MVIVNKSSGSRYSSLAHRNLADGQKSADIDAAGLCKALEAIVKSCGSRFAIRLNGHERDLVSRLLALDDTGCQFRCHKPRESGIQEEMRQRAIAEQRAKEEAFLQARKREEDIMSETTFTSRKDVQTAMDAAANIKGEVVAKKLASTGEAPVSLRDLMGDNKFIEEHMKDTGIKAALASEEGWDTDKMNETNTQEEAPTDEAPEQEQPQESKPAEPVPAEEPVKEVQPKKGRGRRSSK